MSDETEFLPEETAAVNKVLEFVATHKDEIQQLNKRQSELQKLFRQTFNENNLEGIFNDVDERTDYTAYDTKEYSDIEEAATKLGLGFSYEGFYLWTPSTRSC